MARSRNNRQGLLTRSKILRAAEKLFALRGYDGASLREIINLAKVDLALVNYHFRSKENLFHEVLARRAEVINRERLDLLNRAQGRTAQDAVCVESIVDAFVSPVFDKLATTNVGWRNYARLLAEANIVQRHAGPLGEMLNPAAIAFCDALAKARPKQAPARHYWDYMFMVGALMQVLAQTERLERLSKGLCRIQDYRGAHIELRRFLVNALSCDQDAT